MKRGHENGCVSGSHGGRILCLQFCLWLHRSQKSVSAPRQGFHVAWAGSRISQRLPQLVYGGVQAVVKIHEGVGWPQLLAKLLARDDLSGAVQKIKENLK